MDIENYHRFFSAQQLYRIASYGAKMLKKQDETIKEIREVKQAVREEGEKTRTELKSEIRGVKEEIANLRSDLKEYMETNLKRIYGEISEIKKVLKKAGIM
ncbi:hypothetical protein [Archaeoglobus veneficus]|uniref:hypothetical protein n=1 Tax=Archaeoglobus veneficus TaxID=58290 RepID=UPI000693DCD0|nr:hypothetical protein [Archaeoglobus veneficus]